MVFGGIWGKLFLESLVPEMETGLGVGEDLGLSDTMPLREGREKGVGMGERAVYDGKEEA